MLSKQLIDKIDHLVVSSKHAFKMFVVIFAIGYISILYLLWKDVYGSHEAQLNNVVSLSSQNLELTLNSNALLLKILGEALIKDGALDDPAKGQKRIDDALRNSSGIAGFGLVKTNGDVVLLSGVLPATVIHNLLTDKETRPTFKEVLDTGKFHVGHTYYMKTLKTFVLPIRYPLYHSNGEIAAVMTAGFKLGTREISWGGNVLTEHLDFKIVRTTDKLPVYVTPAPVNAEQLKSIYTSPVETSDSELIDVAVRDKSRIHFKYDLNSYSAVKYINEQNLAIIASIDTAKLVSSYFSHIIWPTALFVAIILLGIRLNAAAHTRISESNSRVHELGEWQKTILESTEYSIISTDINGVIVSFNKGAQKMLGYEPEEVIGKFTPLLFHDTNEIQRDAEWLSKKLEYPVEFGFKVLVLKAQFEVSSNKECTYIRKDGARIDVQLNFTELRNSEGILTGYLGLAYDVSEKHKADAELRIAAIAFESQAGILVTDKNQKILRVNKAFTDITGYKLSDVVGLTPKILQSGYTSNSVYKEMMHDLETVGQWQGELSSKRKDGSIFQELITVTAVRDSNGTLSNYVSAFVDITDRKESELQIRKLAFYDPLTSLPNRRLLMDRLEHAIGASSIHGHYSALLFLDLDNFKAINDTMGHAHGDALLVQVATRLQKCVKSSDTVARLGGDEFVVMLENISEDINSAVIEVERVGELIMGELTAAYIIKDRTFYNTCSIGASLFLDESLTVDDIIKQADMAMYQAKADGKNLLRFFNVRMQEIVSTRVELERDFHIALEHAQFEVYYQPQIDINGCLIGLEALVRWNHPTRGVVSPLEFIPFAEETGLIIPLSNFVLREACLFLGRIKQYHSGLTVAVNISAKQFKQKNFVQDMLNIVRDTGASYSDIKLELTESLLLDNVEATIERMMLLKTRGFGFALDDFGTGYSSLVYLKKLPLDQLKIDQGFVRDLLTDPNDAAIASTIVALGRTLNISVLAEGVENMAQLKFLEDKGCYLYQGYMVSKPLPAAEMIAFVRDHKPEVLMAR